MKIDHHAKIHFEETPTNLIHITILGVIFVMFAFFVYILYLLDTLIGARLAIPIEILTMIIISAFILIFAYLILYWQRGTKKHLESLSRHTKIYKLHWNSRKRILRPSHIKK